MSKKMREQIDSFKNFLTESKKKSKSDVSDEVSDDKYVVLYMNSDKKWTQSSPKVYNNIDEAISFIGDKEGLKIFKMIQ